MPYWPIRHGPTLSLYYKDPDGNRLEFQVDCFATAEEANAYMRGDSFAANPIGVEFDPEELVAQSGKACPKRDSSPGPTGREGRSRASTASAPERWRFSRNDGLHAATRCALVAGLWIFAAGAWAQGKVATVGVLIAVSSAGHAPHLEQLRKGLRDLGYVEGRNLRIEVRYADAKIERLPQLAAELAAIPVDVLVTRRSHVTRVARKATRDVPIVMAWAGDPVGGGLADSLARPGGRSPALPRLCLSLAASASRSSERSCRR